MATKRRGRGAFRPPELRGTLGTLLRTAWQQAGGVRDALERGAREGKERLDGLRSDRRRQELLAELGQVVLELIREGEIDLAQLPEAADVLHELDHLDDAGHARGHPHDHDGDHDHDHTDAHAHAHGHAASPRGLRDDDDGTVSSGAKWSARAPAPQRVWRPPGGDGPPTERGVKKPGPPERKGGITFEDDDDDLGSYMHPDDVPPKSSDDER